MAIFECLDYHDEASFPNLMETLGAFDEGLTRYREHRLRPRRADWFQKALEANPGDRLSSLYVDRCRVMRETPAAGRLGRRLGDDREVDARMRVVVVPIECAWEDSNLRPTA